MRKSAAEYIRQLEARIALLEKKARRIDYTQEGLDEMGQGPAIEMTEQGVLDFISKRAGVYGPDHNLRSVRVSDEGGRGIKIVTTFVSKYEAKHLGRRDYTTRYFSGGDVMFFDYYSGEMISRKSMGTVQIDRMDYERVSKRGVRVTIR